MFAEFGPARVYDSGKAAGVGTVGLYDHEPVDNTITAVVVERRADLRGRKRAIAVVAGGVRPAEKGKQNR
jgi:hypothetical protein